MLRETETGYEQRQERRANPGPNEAERAFLNQKRAFEKLLNNPFGPDKSAASADMLEIELVSESLPDMAMVRPNEEVRKVFCLRNKSREMLVAELGRLEVIECSHRHVIVRCPQTTTSAFKD